MTFNRGIRWIALGGDLHTAVLVSVFRDIHLVWS